MDQLADQHAEVNSVRSREVDHCQLFEIDTGIDEVDGDHLDRQLICS